MRIVTATLVAAGLLAACGGESPSEPDTPSSHPDGHGTYAECLNEHGVPATPVPNTGPPAGVDREAWEQALKSCASLAPGPG